MNNNKSGGIGFIGLLTILLIALKLTGVITVSWLVVCAPFLISLTVGILIVIVYIIWESVSK